MRTTSLTRRFSAPPAAVYGALVEAEAVAAWMFPDGMSIEIHEFEPRVGGHFRISLTYEGDFGVGKTSARTDTYSGRFSELVPNQHVLEVLEFETSDPAMRGEMTITFTLTEVEGGTELVARHENVPPGISLADNEMGWSTSLARLKTLIEQTSA